MIKGENSKIASKRFGEIAKIKIPKFMRTLIYKIYSKMYNVNLHEIPMPLNSYESLGDFFTRKVKPRPIPAESSLLVPADSRILSISEITSDSSFIVKNLTYSLGEFLTGSPIKLT